MKIFDLLSGTRILAEYKSKVSGKIEVVRDFTWGVYVKIEGFTQSGGILTQIWKETLRKILIKKPHIQSCLILGLGGGSVAKLVSQYWVGTSIVGVDIDSQIVEVGKKYLGLNSFKIDIRIVDALKFTQKDKTKYDLILVDLYSGDKFPDKFESVKFVTGVKRLLSKQGIAVFNRLYGPNYSKDSLKFGEMLEKVFEKVDYMFPQANVEFICYN